MNNAFTAEPLFSDKTKIILFSDEQIDKQRGKKYLKELSGSFLVDNSIGFPAF